MKRTRVGVCALTVALVAAGLGLGVARAAKGLAGLKGEIIVSDQGLPVLDDEDKMVAELKRLQKAVIEKPKGAESWSFTIMGFLDKKAGTSTVALMFFDTAGGKRNYLTSKEISCD